MIAILELALPFRLAAETKPTLGELARLAGQASRLFRMKDVDEAISVQNAATVALAKKHNIMS